MSRKIIRKMEILDLSLFMSNVCNTSIQCVFEPRGEKSLIRSGEDQSLLSTMLSYLDICNLPGYM